MRYRDLLSSFLCLSLSMGTVQLHAQAGAQKAGGRKSLQHLRWRSGEDFTLRIDRENGTVSFLKGKLSGALDQAKIQHSALQVLENHAEALAIKKPSEEFVLRQSSRDNLGMTHVRLSQRHGKIPVFGGEIVVHFNADGSARSVSGRYFPTPEIEATPALSSEQAIVMATAQLDTTPILRTPITAELNIYGQGQKASLVWKVVIPAWHPLGNWTYFVDAHGGEVLNFFNDMPTDGPAVGSGTGLDGAAKPVHSYLEGADYWMIDTSLPMYSGTFGRENTAGAILGYDAFSTTVDMALIHDPNNDNIWNDSPGLRSAVSAHHFFRQTLEFYRTEYGRNSWDDRGSSVRFIVHYSQKYNNAFYNGNGTMFFGDGDGVIMSDLAGGLDVVAHEFTHGVTETSAGLVYQNQSGALNESMSDIIGVLIDAEDWLLGEDIWTPGVSGDALRSVDDPALFDDPDHMDDYLLLSPGNDNGGVHTNSGIINKAFYNIASVIGRGKAGQIFYRALTFYMTPLTQFVDARRFCLAAAEDLYGKSSPEYKAVQGGFDAVGIVDGPPTLTPVALKLGETVAASLGQQEYDLFYVEMPENKYSLRVTTTETSFDALDLYVSHQRIPDPETAEYASEGFGTETIAIKATSFPPVASGRYYILARAWNGGNYTITATAADPQIVYVDKDAAGANNGVSWANAFTTIQAGLDSANTRDKWVWVAEGTYNQRITLKLGVALFGGFNGTETALNQRNPLLRQTIIDGQRGGTVVTCEDSARIDGFIIQNGNASFGAGLNAASDGVLISNNVIRNNAATSAGGIYASGSFPPTAVVGNLLYGNSTGTTGNGAGMYFDFSTAYVSANTVVNNNGDGIYVSASSSTLPILENLVVRGNTTQIDGPTAVIDYSNIQGGSVGIGNIDGDPIFVNAATNDYHLKANSPCIDAGNPSQRDPDGTRRDMGAFYFAHTITGSEIAVNRSTLNFGSVFLGEKALRILIIENRGAAELIVASMTTSNPAYQLSEAAMNIPAGEARNLFVTYTPSSAAAQNATLTLNSNDADEGSLTVALTGSGSALPPQMAVTPEALAAAAGLNGKAQSFVVVENKGASSLNYSVKVSSANFQAEPFGAQDNAFGSSSRMIGNIYRTSVATQLTRIEMFFNNSSSSNAIEYAVYQAESLPGPTVRIFRKMINNPGTGQKFYSSGDIAVSLQANKYYFIGAAWSNFLTYYQANAAPPDSGSFGTLEHGAAAFFFPAPQIFDPAVAFTQPAYYQRLTTGGNGWASASTTSGALAPGASDSVQVDMDAANLAEGEYHAGVTITGNDPNRVRQHIPLVFRVVGAGLPLRHFTFTGSTGDSYPIIVDRAELGKPPASLEFGDEIGVYTPAGLCVGAAVWTGAGALAISAWKDDDQTPVVDGFKDGEAMSFRIWEASVNAEYPATATYSAGNGNFGFGLLSRISLLEGRVVITRSAALGSRWSWISTPIKPDNLNAAAFTQSLENLVIMKDNAGRFYTPIPPPFNGIGNIKIQEGYAVYLSAPDVLEVTGEDIADNEPIALVSGWNFAAYFPQSEMDIATALASIKSRLNIVKSDDGGVYIPDLVNTIGRMRPFEGYKMNLSGAATLIYPTSSSALARAASTPAVERQTPQFYQPLRRSADYHVVIINRFSSQSFSLSENDEVGIFTADRLCVGAARVSLQTPTVVPVWQDDPNTPEHDGYSAGEALHYRLYRAAISTEHNLSGNWSGDLAKSAFVQMSLSEAQMPANYELSQNFPNPFNPETVIRFALPKSSKVKLEIYDVLGRRVRALLAAEKPAGFHEVNWNGRDESGRPVPSGLYFYKLSAGEFSAVKKMSMIK